MDWPYVVLLVLWIVLTLWALWVLFRRPTGPRIVRAARQYRAAHPEATANDVREALRQRFLGTNTQIDPVDAVAAPEGCLVGIAFAVAEGIRDFFAPVDRTRVAQRIEAAVQIVFAPKDAANSDG